MKAGIEVIDGIGENRGVEAARLVPGRAVCATIDWPLPADDSEGTVRPEVIAALSHALAACGSVAFRYDAPLAGTIQEAPPGSLTKRFLDVAGLGRDRFGLVVATDPTTVSALFSYGGWSYAAQAALVFDPACDPAPMLAALRDGHRWQGRTLPPGTRLLFGPGHDGDFAVAAATDVVWLDRLKAALA